MSFSLILSIALVFWHIFRVFTIRVCVSELEVLWVEPLLWPLCIINQSSCLSFPSLVPLGLTSEESFVVDVVSENPLASNRPLDLNEKRLLQASLLALFYVAVKALLERETGEAEKFGKLAKLELSVVLGYKVSVLGIGL